MKSKPKKSQEPTGAPDAHFLKYLAIQENTKVLLEGSRMERAELRQLPTEAIGRQVWLGLLELTDRISRPKQLPSGILDNGAAKCLAAVATAATDILKDLAFSDSLDVHRQIVFTATAKHRWPVNLSLGKKKNVKGAILEGAAEAKAYLTRIRLGEQPGHALKDMGRDTGIFTRAAQLLVQSLLEIIQARPPNKMTSWYRALYRLEFPITETNVKEWWRLAKLYMDEQWEKHPELFDPLKEACSSQGKKLTKAGLFGSEVKTRVIDLRLKESFFALAKRH